MTTTITKYFILILVAFHLSSCSCNNAQTRYKAANEKVDKFFSWMEQGNMDSVLTLIGKNIYDKRDSIRLRDTLTKVSKTIKITSKKNISSSYKTEYASGNKIEYLQTIYRVKNYNDSTMYFTFLFVTDKINDTRIINLDVD